MSELMKGEEQETGPEMATGAEDAFPLPGPPSADRTMTLLPHAQGNAPAASALLLPLRYRDLGRIAAGSFGEIRRVLDTELDRVVAMKLLRANLADVEQLQVRFLAEAKLTAGLEHPGIVGVHDRGRLEDGRLWFTMREVRGRTLGDVIDEVHAAAGREGFGETASGWTFRRLVDAFARVCHAWPPATPTRYGVALRGLSRPRPMPVAPPTTAPEPAPMAPPVTARWPQVSPQAATERRIAKVEAILSADMKASCAMEMAGA